MSFEILKTRVRNGAQAGLDCLSHLLRR
jgi:hypothetical protein